MIQYRRTKKLYRSDTNAVLGGVLGGLGEYFELDPVLLRLVFITFLILTGVFPGVLIYMVAYLVMPVRPDGPTIIDI